jgi:hypothetical protein
VPGNIAIHQTNPWSKLGYLLGYNAARVGGKRNACRDWWERLKERDHFVDLGVDGDKTLKWILKNRSVWFGIGTGGGLL